MKQSVIPSLRELSVVDNTHQVHTFYTKMMHQDYSKTNDFLNEQQKSVAEYKDHVLH